MDLHTLNACVLALAGGHEPRDDAPGTFGELMTAQDRLLLPVWAGASDKTVYGCARVNWAFRAWHDRTHARYGLDFSREGELITARFQVRELLELCPSAPRWAAELVFAEVAAPLDYLAEHGSFPLDGAACVWQWLGNIPT